MDDYNNYLKMIQKANQKYVVVRDIDPTTNRECNFIATEDKENSNEIIVAMFELSGDIMGIYYADACESLDEFKESE